MDILKGILLFIPNFDASGVLPPFINGTPTLPANQAPYLVDLSHFVTHFATSAERIKILNGFLDYRSKLKATGVVDGFQWIDGSFVEDVELTRGRPPSDIDIVTFAYTPVPNTRAEQIKFITNNEELFKAPLSKKKYMCDAYFVNLEAKPKFLVKQSQYWFGLFSHQKATSIWKGMIELDLSCDESEAKKILVKIGVQYAT
jgi:hypothetical protein